MALIKTALSTLALGTMMFGSTAALADGPTVRGSVELRVGTGHYDDHRDDRRYDDRGYNRPRPAPRPGGRYELQTVQRWVEGRYEQVWVPEVCRERGGRYRRVERCSGGYYDNQWVAGHYEPVQEWVWVQDSWGNRPHPAGYWR